MGGSEKGLILPTHMRQEKPRQYVDHIFQSCTLSRARSPLLGFVNPRLHQRHETITQKMIRGNISENIEGRQYALLKAQAG